MQPVQSCLHCQFLSHVLKALIFIKLSLKLSYFSKKMQSFLYLGLRPQTPVPPAAGGSFAPRPLKYLSIANFWQRARSLYCCYVMLCKPILRLAGVYGFPPAALSLHKFDHPCFRLTEIVAILKCSTSIICLRIISFKLSSAISYVIRHWLFGP